MRAARAAILVVLAAGCGDGRPRAPALTREAVFRDDALKVRFPAPDGWAMTGRAAVPGGRLWPPLSAVGYGHLRGGGAELELLAADAPADRDGPAVLAEKPLGPRKWADRGPPVPVSAGGLTGTRYAYSAADKGPAQEREVTAFRRGDRLLLFVATYPKGDLNARDAARAAAAGLAWAD